MLSIQKGSHHNPLPLYNKFAKQSNTIIYIFHSQNDGDTHLRFILLPLILMEIIKSNTHTQLLIN